jgi:hypothetical protein
MPAQRLLFIGVDELIKFPSHPELLSLVGSTMDRVWEFHVPNIVGKCPLIILPLVTSLSSLVVDRSVTPISNRDVAWIPLGPLFGAAEHIIEVEPLLFDSDASAQKALRILCIDLGEHGRMLEKLLEYLKEDGNKNLNLLCDNGMSEVSRILKALEGPCKAYLPAELATAKGLSIVSAALLGQPVDRDTYPNGLAKTYEDLLSSGTYISSETSGSGIQSLITPVLTPFQLLFWARNVLGCGGLVSQVAVVLLRVMTRDSKADGFTFEEFVCGTYLRSLRICFVNLFFLFFSVVFYCFLHRFLCADPFFICHVS